jgi:hypothetical protein
MKFSPDSKKLVISGLIPGATTIWNLEDENKTEIGRSLSIDFVPDGTNLVLAVATGQKYADVPSPVYLLDLENDERDYLFLDYYYSGKIAVSPDGKYLGAYVTDELGFGNVRLVNMPEGVEIPLGGIIKSCGLAKEKGWRILVGDETYKAVRNRKENTPWTTIPHSLMMFDLKYLQP